MENQLPSSPMQDSVQPSPGVTSLPTPPAVKPNWPLIILSVIVGGLLIYILFLFRQNQQLENQLRNNPAPSKVSNYAECIQVAGARIQESYPATCVTPDGDRFTQEVSVPADTTENSESEASVPDDWETYSSPSGGHTTYTFRYPLGLRLDRGAGGSNLESIRFTYIGPTQVASGRTESELFDGYAFVVVKQGPTTELDLPAEVERSRQNAAQNCQELSEITSIKISNIDAFQYTGNCMTTYTTTYLSDGQDTYSISQTYSGSNQAEYKKITDQILSTFKFVSGE